MELHLGIRDKLKAAFRRPSRLDRQLFLVDTVALQPPAAGADEDQRKPLFLLHGWLEQGWQRDPEAIDLYVFPEAIPGLDPQTVETLERGQWIEVEATPSPAPLPAGSRLARAFRVRDDLSVRIGKEVLSTHAAENAPRP